MNEDSPQQASQQQPRNVGSNMWEHLKRGGESAAESAQRHFSIQRLNSRIRRLKRRRRKLFYAIGDKVYALHRKGKVRHADVLPSCEGIDAIVEEIGKLLDEIQIIQAGASHPDAEPEPPQDDGFLTVAEDDQADEADAEITADETPEQDAKAGPPAADEEPEAEDSRPADEDAGGPADEDADDDLDIELSDLDDEDE